MNRSPNTGADVLTVDTLNALYGDINWGGFGYLGERQTHYFTQRANAEFGDQVLLAYANRHGWSIRDLFNYTNSRSGRRYGELVFGGFTHDEILASSKAYFVGALV
jgi:predicted DNA-binding WGR domain protein